MPLIAERKCVSFTKKRKTLASWFLQRFNLMGVPVGFTPMKQLGAQILFQAQEMPL